MPPVQVPAQHGSVCPDAQSVPPGRQPQAHCVGGPVIWQRPS